MQLEKWQQKCLATFGIGPRLSHFFSMVLWILSSCDSMRVPRAQEVQRHSGWLSAASTQLNNPVVMEA